MSNVSPPTSRLRLTDDQGYITRQGVQFLQDFVNRAGGVGDVTLLASLSVGSSTDNAVSRFDGTDGDKLQSSQVTVDDSGNVGVPGGSTVDGRDVSADGTKLDGIEAGAEVNTVDSVFGRTGDITAQSGDYTTDQVTEAANLYFTDERAQDAVGGIVTGDTNITTTYDDAANTLTIALASTLDLTAKTLSFPTENVTLDDAGSAGATEQDWLKITVGGVTGYIRVFASK